MSNSQNSQMNKGFLSHLMAHLLEGSQIPKVQVERSVGPVLGFFLAEVLTATLKDDGALSGRYRMLCPNFHSPKETACSRPISTFCSTTKTGRPWFFWSSRR